MDFWLFCSFDISSLQQKAQRRTLEWFLYTISLQIFEVERIQHQNTLYLLRTANNFAISTPKAGELQQKPSRNMALVHVLDNYYLAISFLICLGYQAIFFAISVGFKTDQLNDVAGGTNFIILAIITVSMYGQHEARQIVDSIFIMIWGARLAGFLLFRIIKTGKDDRFDDKRGKFLPMLGFYTFQTLWVGIEHLLPAISY
jgi:hypothetical protein